jgi:hypothetical protein
MLWLARAADDSTEAIDVPTRTIEGRLTRRRTRPKLPTRPRQPAPKKATPPSRTGRVLIGAHFAPEVQTALKIIAAEERITMQALPAEAINAVFAKRHKPKIAQLVPIEDT